MNRDLLFVLFNLLCSNLSAQESTFDYYRKGTYVQMSNGVSSIEFDAYKSAVRGTKERAVLSKGISYRLLIKNGKFGTIKTVVNLKDSVLATVFLSGDNLNSILLPDGRMLKYEKLSSGRWSYSNNGQKVINYSTKRNGKFSNVKVGYNDKAYLTDVLEIICLEHGAEVLKRKKPPLLIIGLATRGILLQAALEQAGLLYQESDFEKSDILYSNTKLLFARICSKDAASY
jgi:hypothetical protein